MEAPRLTLAPSPAHRPPINTHTPQQRGAVAAKTTAPLGQKRPVVARAPVAARAQVRPNAGVGRSTRDPSMWRFSPARARHRLRSAGASEPARAASEWWRRIGGGVLLLPPPPLACGPAGPPRAPHSMRGCVERVERPSIPRRPKPDDAWIAREGARTRALCFSPPHRRCRRRRSACCCRRPSLNPPPPPL